MIGISWQGAHALTTENHWPETTPVQTSATRLNNMHRPTYEEFRAFSSQGKTIPVYRELQADTLTPVRAFLAVDDGRTSFLLESATGDDQWGRYSFVGSRPHAVITVDGLSLRIAHSNGEVQHCQTTDPAAALVEFLHSQDPVSIPDLPRFSGGLVGFLSYDAVRWFESVPNTHDQIPGIPTAGFLLTDLVCIFDASRQSVKVVVHARVDAHSSVDEAYRAACQRIDDTIHRLYTHQPPPTPIDRLPSTITPCSVVAESLTREAYCTAVRASKAYITAGDIIQVVLSRRFETAPSVVDPFEVYRMLRTLNPSPYLFFLRMLDYCIGGSSPEVLVRLTERRIEVRPIAGTRKRGNTADEDKQIAVDLLKDPKEVAEHIMLLDLGRNDVGRVAQIGTVRVHDVMNIERYSHVMHIVSGVHGNLDPKFSSADVLRATFPAGTLTGAPKVRAMEIIEELEPVRRGFYGGSVGYIDFSGSIDMCIAIRSFLHTQGKFIVQAGAGIVADSVPELECDETEAKAVAVLKAIAMAECALLKESE